ncbi:MAG: SAM-dependent chlorinase/fluorinase [Candidatus Taylorbacteria bacterium]|nr:SAM-dependent chlorinase/fluorinase [Candidatus Taylorbacteria bacterium]
MQIKRLVIVTDCVDIAANELRASIINEIGDRKDIEIEPFVPIREFSVVNCNFALRLMADLYPPGTLFSVIFNPVKERPKSLIGKTKKKDFIFMGRNTGAFDWLTRDFGCTELYDASGLFTDLSKQFLSFSGKLVTAPTIAKIACGEDIKNLGAPVSPEEITRLNIVGHTIVHIDNFGMMKFTGDLDNIKENNYYKVEINETKIKAIFCKRMMSQETGSWVIFPGSSLGMYELGKVREYGAKSINAKIGDILKITKLI